MAADADWLDTCRWLVGSAIAFGGGTDAHGTAIAKTACDRTLSLRDVPQHARRRRGGARVRVQPAPLPGSTG